MCLLKDQLITYLVKWNEYLKLFFSITLGFDHIERWYGYSPSKGKTTFY